MPDVFIVLPDGAVGGEVAGLGDIHQHLPGPGLPVAVLADGQVLDGDILLQIQQAWRN